MLTMHYCAAIPSNSSDGCQPYDSRGQLNRIEDQLVGITARARLIEGKLDKLLQPLYVGIDWASGPDSSAENRVRLHSEHKEGKQ